MTRRAVLRRALRDHRGTLVAASTLVAGHQAGEALVPVVIGVIIDRAVGRGSVPSLLFWLAVLGLLFLTFSLCFRFGARFAERAAELASHDIRLRLTARILDPAGGADQGRLPGAMVSIATEDADRVGGRNLVLPYGVAAIAGLLVGSVALLRMSVPLGLLVLLGAPPLLWLAYLLSKPLERRSDAEQDRAAHASGVAADLVAGLRVVKGLHAEPAAVARYRLTSRESLSATVRAARAQAGQDGAMVALTGVFLAVVALVGARLAFSGAITVGQLVAAVGLAQFLLGPLSVFSWVNAEFAQARASAARVAAVLATPPATEPAAAMDSATVDTGTADTGTAVPAQRAAAPGTALSFHDVQAGPVRSVSADVAGGSFVAVAADDPAAVTALLRCLAREADPEGGDIRLGGTPLRVIAPADVRAAVLVADHHADLFEESVADNVRAAGAPAALVERALAAAGADEVCAVLPDGADTVLAERGKSLSGGQRQRVALARALAADPPVLVLHDPTTAVDAVTEARIAAGLRALREGRTTLVFTTSPALLARADRVLFLTGGTIVAEGRHAELVRGHATYRELVFG